jgi:hypothetical protein
MHTCSSNTLRCMHGMHTSASHTRCFHSLVISYQCSMLCCWCELCTVCAASSSITGSWHHQLRQHRNAHSQHAPQMRCSVPSQCVNKPAAPCSPSSLWQAAHVLRPGACMPHIHGSEPPPTAHLPPTSWGKPMPLLTGHRARCAGHWAVCCCTTLRLSCLLRMSAATDPGHCCSQRRCKQQHCAPPQRDEAHPPCQPDEPARQPAASSQNVETHTHTRAPTLQLSALQCGEACPWNATEALPRCA